MFGPVGFDKLRRQFGRFRFATAVRGRKAEDENAHKARFHNPVGDGTVYDDHKRGTINNLTGVQHDFGDLIVCTQHVHFDRCNCMEVIVVCGHAAKIRELLVHLKSITGIKHSSLMMATTEGVE